MSETMRIGDNEWRIKVAYLIRRTRKLIGRDVAKQVRDWAREANAERHGELVGKT